MSDLFQRNKPTKEEYTAKDIEVLEGLEPVRRRPGMYIGGTDERALHHLAVEIIDNAMDEAVAGHASRIEIRLNGDGSLTVEDNGRGIPIDPHPKFPDKSALEVILTTLHSGAKFGSKAYETSGGLHGVGLSVVNALASHLTVNIFQKKTRWTQEYSQGHPLTALENKGGASKRGTQITFKADPEIFGTLTFKPSTLCRIARSKAYLFKGVEIRWFCDPSLIQDDTPPEAIFHFPQGLVDYLKEGLTPESMVLPDIFSGVVPFTEGPGRVEWAVAWTEEEASFTSYCNTILTPLGGTHESGFRQALTKALRTYGDLSGNKKASVITADDVFTGLKGVLSVFIGNPQFQGQTKEKLSTPEAQKWVEAALKDHMDHWLAHQPKDAQALLEWIIEKADERLRKKQAKEISRLSATRRLRLPGKLADCSISSAAGTEIFLVEGDSAGGSAKQARDRKTQAVLPLRGKILNVANATLEKLQQNQELTDLSLALGCGLGKSCDPQKLRYERVIIMTDADVDGAHIASLLLTFFFREMRPLLEAGAIYLAQPPLYRLAAGGKSIYAQDDVHRDHLLKTEFKKYSKVEVSRFKGLGEMLPQQLKHTTMAYESRTLTQVTLDRALQEMTLFVENLMGKRPESRFDFIRNNAKLVKTIDL